MSTTNESPKSRSTYGPQRRVAARNREAILEAAHELFSASPTVSMNEIAKRAGVGAGTLYRHFPTRESLILAVYRHDIEKLVVEAEIQLAQQSTAREAFTAWFTMLAAYIRVKHGLGEALHHAAIQDAINETYAPIVAAVSRLLSACVEEGSIRPGADPGDVLLLMGFLWRTGHDEVGLAQGERIIDLVFRGIGTR